MLRRIRIVVADDLASIRHVLAHLFAGVDEFEVVGEAEDGVAAVELAHLLQPDVIIMDFYMPNMNGVQATRRITCECPAVRVVGYSSHDHEGQTNSMLEAGAVACVAKGYISDLLEGVRQASGDAHK